MSSQVPAGKIAGSMTQVGSTVADYCGMAKQAENLMKKWSFNLRYSGLAHRGALRRLTPLRPLRHALPNI